MQSKKRPLAGVRIVDLSQVFAMPYAGGLLADLGAEVIKIEAPHRVDQTRTYGALPENTPGEEPWNQTGTFLTLNRGKRSLVLDLVRESAREVFRKLAAQTDIVIENFTPRVMRGWGLDYAALKKVRPDIIMLSNTGYGSTGPWAPYPSQGTVIEATIGISAYTGYRGGKPSRVGQSYPDFLAAWIGLYAILAALHYRDRTGQGQWIDLGMYQLGASFVPEALLQYQVNGTEPQRIGNEHEDFVPYNLYPAAGSDEWIAICVMSDTDWSVLTEAMGRTDLAGEADLATARGRVEHREEIDAAVAGWTRGFDARQLAGRLRRGGLAAGAVLNSRDLMTDPQLKHRGFFEYVAHADPIGVRPLIGRPYGISGAEVSISRPAARLGEDNLYVLRDLLGLDQEEIDNLYADGAVRDEPVSPRMASGINVESGLRAGTIRQADADYRTKLGI